MIEPGDIKQGLLGDCYFLSVLSILAEHPLRIKNLFKSQYRNDQGIYGVKLLNKGEYKEIVVDDYFPCLGGEPAFSKANGRELWVLLLEKAWAKKFGSYERIEAGFAENVMHDLTGAPAFSV
jgi:calpain-15